MNSRLAQPDPNPQTARHDSSLTDSTHSSGSSSSAERFALDDGDSRPILLYQYRGKLQTSSQKDLCALLDKDEKLRVTKKQIPRYSTFVDVKRHDLFLPDEKERYSQQPNFDSSLASIKIPFQSYWRNAVFGQFSSLYIISPESSPNSSLADPDSRHTSPTSTWSRDGDDTRVGLGQDI